MDNTKEYRRYIKACEKYVDTWYEAVQVVEHFKLFPSEDNCVSLEQAFFGRTRRKYLRAKKRFIKTKKKLESVEQDET